MRVLEELQKSSIDVSQSLIDRAAITDFFVRDDAFFLQLFNLPFVGGDQNLAIRSHDAINQLLDFHINELLLLLEGCFSILSIEHTSLLCFLNHL